MSLKSTINADLKLHIFYISETNSDFDRPASALGYNKLFVYNGLILTQVWTRTTKI